MKDPRKVTQPELVELISHGINFTKPRLCYTCKIIEEPGRPSSYKGLKCSMCGYAVCNAYNLSREEYQKLGKTMKGLTIQCAGCKEWGQGGIYSMFKAGPTGSLAAEAKAFVYLKQ